MDTCILFMCFWGIFQSDSNGVGSVSWAIQLPGAQPIPKYMYISDWSQFVGTATVDGYKQSFWMHQPASSCPFVLGIWKHLGYTWKCLSYIMYSLRGMRKGRALLMILFCFYTKYYDIKWQCSVNLYSRYCLPTYYRFVIRIWHIKHVPAIMHTCNLYYMYHGKKHFGDNYH